MGDCVGKACAVHVHFQAVAFGDLGQGAHLVDRVHRAQFGGLGDRYGTGFGVVQIGALGGHCVQRLRAEFSQLS